MDFIKNGRQLRQCWPSLSIWAKFKIVLTVRHYLKQLRRIQHPRSDRPGPLGEGVRHQECEGWLFGNQGTMSFETKEDLAKYYRKVHAGALRHGPYRHTYVPPFDDSICSRLVFTHNYLTMSNLILDDDQRLWMIDWGCAGFFPPSFEYVGMRLAGQTCEEPQDWLAAIKFMAEPAFEVETWMIKVGFGPLDKKLR